MGVLIVFYLPSFVQFGIRNDEVGGVGEAEEEVGGKKYKKVSFNLAISIIIGTFA